METRPASTVMAKNGSPRHTLTMITAAIAKVDMPSQFGPGGVMMPRRIAVQFTTL